MAIVLLAFIAQEQLQYFSSSTSTSTSIISSSIFEAAEYEICAGAAVSVL
jgi:hypothetical protein